MNTATQYQKIAKKRGLDDEEVVAPDYFEWKPEEAVTPAAASTPIKILSIKKL